MIYEVDILSAWLKQAMRESREMGALRESITKGDGNVAGFIGELAVHDLIGGEHKPTFDYDIIRPDGKFDVKTKRCTSTPMPEYECSIANYNPNQQCDFYVFTRVLEDYKTCWVLGYLPKAEYFAKARFCRKGEVDTKSTLGWTFKADCYNLEIKELKDIYDLRS